MELQPAAFARQLQTRTVFRVPLSPNRNGTIDLLDIDLAILVRFEGLSVLHKTPRGLFRVGKRAIGYKFHWLG